jgi:hypothetical protein
MRNRGLDGLKAKGKPVPAAGMDRLALAHPCTRSAGGRGARRGHPWPLFLPFVGGALGSIPHIGHGKNLEPAVGIEPTTC